jgi:Zn-dependent peptidase ImmA (M78 family)/DNA-binding XRE family transcriptional regulator
VARQSDARTAGRRNAQAFDGEPSEFRERMKRLRLMRRWDQATLAQLTNIHVTTISQIERGRAVATEEQRAAIGRAFGYSDSFMSASMDLLPTTRPWLRAYADASKKEADARTALATLSVEYIRSLRLKPLPDVLPWFDAPLGDDDAIEEAAAEVRSIAGLDPDAVVGNATRAAERLGCVVLPLDSELGKHLGMSVRADNVPIVCVAKSGIPGDRQRWTVAHEIGHLVLHGDASPPQSAAEASAMEKQAHRFAAAFLTPGDAVVETLHEVGGKATLRALADVKSVWGVAIKSLVGRYNALGEINDAAARSLYKQISARKWSKSEPVRVDTESAQWFARTLMQRAETDDIAQAALLLAAEVGGNHNDLYHLADWSAPSEADVIPFARPVRVSQSSGS